MKKKNANDKKMNQVYLNEIYRLLKKINDMNRLRQIYTVLKNLAG